MSRNIYTIGHSNHTWEAFLPLLTRHGVELLGSHPASRFARFANKRVLPARLEEAGIGHLWMGDRLGGKPADPSLWDAAGAPDYAKIGSRPQFAEGITELVAVANRTTVALMCAEEDPWKFHRALLLGPALSAHGLDLAHIRKHGSLGWRCVGSVAGHRATWH